MKPDVHFSSVSSEWETPDYVYNRLNDIYHFTLDPCSTDVNARCERHYTKATDGLAHSWVNEQAFMNPPYGREIRHWIEKAYTDSCVGDTTVVALIPARTDTAWWHEYVTQATKILFVKGRIKFMNRTLPSWNESGDYTISPAPFPSAIVVFGQDVDGMRSTAPTYGAITFKESV